MVFRYHVPLLDLEEGGTRYEHPSRPEPPVGQRQTAEESDLVCIVFRGESLTTEAGCLVSESVAC